MEIKNIVCGIHSEIVLPNDPSNLHGVIAVGGYGLIRVSWQTPTLNPYAVAYYIIQRSTTPELSTADIIGKTSSDFYVDTEMETDVIQYYWVTAISINGTRSPAEGPASALAEPSIKKIMQDLTEQIDEGLLSQSLKEEIARIGTIETELLDLSVDIDGELGAFGLSVQAAQDTIADAIMAVESETAERRTEIDNLSVNINNSFNTIGAEISTINTVIVDNHLALTQSIDTHISEYNTNKAEVTGKLNTLANADTAFTQRLDSHVSVFESNKSAVENQITTLSNAQGSTAQSVINLKAEFDSQEVGGRNLLRNTDKPSTFVAWRSRTSLTEISDDVGNLGIRVEATGNGEIAFRPIWGSKLVQGRQYTLSFYVASSISRLDYCHIMRPSGGNRPLSAIDVTDELTKVTVTITATWSTDKGSILIGAKGVVAGDWIEIYGLQLEEGNVATAWSLNPDDISEEFSNISADISSTNTVIANNHQTLTSQLTTHISNYESNKASVDSSLTTLSNADSAGTQALNNHVSEYNSNKASVNTQITTLSNAQSAQAQAHNTLKAEFNSQEIGGRNLIPKSDKFDAFRLWKGRGNLTGYRAWENSQGFKLYVHNNLSHGIISASGIELISGRTYTLSFRGQGTFNSLNHCYLLSDSNPNHMLEAIPFGSGGNTKRTLTFEAPYSAKDVYILIGTRGRANGDWFTFYHLQLEMGNTPTEWTPNPDDFSDSLDGISAEIAATNTVVANNKQASTQALNTHISNYDSNKSAVQGQISTLSTEQLSLATQINTAEASLGNQIAAVQTTAQAWVNAVDGKADVIGNKTDAIGARYTVNVNANGLVGGFGIYNTGATVEAGFEVDKFWIGSTTANKVKPFILSGGTVYIDTARIRDLGAENIKANAIQTVHMQVNSIHGNRITGGTIHGDKITANTVNGNRIIANTINADRINATNLSSISANLGSITGGSLNINNRFTVASNGNVNLSSGASGQRTQITNNGIMVYDSNNRLVVRIGVW